MLAYFNLSNLLAALCLRRSRIRHVKCDEEKPSCKQCRRTGRICDGYAPVGQENKIDVPSLLYSKVAALAPAVTEYYAGLTSDNEKHFYDFFHCQVRPEINLAFSSSIHANQLILQASHTNATIKHLVIALGAMSKHLNQTKAPSSDADDQEKSLNYAESQYSKAISQLRRDMSATEKVPTEVVLTSCLLLTLFDFLRGLEDNARTHMAAGIDIVRRCYASELQILSTIHPKGDCPSVKPFIRDFALIFSVLDLFGTVWLGLSSFKAPPLLAVEWLGPLQPLKPDFTLDDLAHNSLNHQAWLAQYFHRVNAPYCDTIVPFHIQAEKQRLLYDLQQWPLALEQWEARNPELNELQRDRVMLLRISYHATLIYLTTLFLDPVAAFVAYEAFTPTFAAIVTGARALLMPSPSSPPTSAPSLAKANSTPSSAFTLQETNTTDRIKQLLRAIAANCMEPDAENIGPFGFVLGVIQPLYLVATKCQDLALREEALVLLESRGWREGAWDSGVMAGLARRKVQGRL